jgi:hypothetical protein
MQALGSITVRFADFKFLYYYCALVIYSPDILTAAHVTRKLILRERI